MKIKDLTYETSENLCLYRASEFGQEKCTNCPLHTDFGNCYKYYLKGIALGKKCPQNIENEMKEIENNEIYSEIKPFKLNVLRECKNCKHHHTITCPNSNDCYAIDSKPFFEPKELNLAEFIDKKVKIYFKKEKGVVFCDKTTGVLRYCVHPNHPTIGECYYLEQNGELEGINIYFIDKIKILSKGRKSYEK